MAFVYFIMGALFTYLAMQSADESIWNPLTIILLLVAALDFLVATHFFRKALRKKQ